MVSLVSAVVLVLCISVCEGLEVSISHNATVHVGGSTELRCEYSGVRDPDKVMISWKFTSEKSASSAASGIWEYDASKQMDTAVGRGKLGRKFLRISTDVANSHAIRIQNVSLEDAGLYTCDVESLSDSNPKYLDGKAVMAISVVELELTKSPETNIQVGSVVILHCTFGKQASSSSKLKLRRNGVEKEESVGGEPIQYPYHVSSKSDNLMNFSCESVGLKGGQKSAQITIPVLFSATRIHMIGTAQNVLEGNPAEFTCETDSGNPTPQVEWYLEGNNEPLQDVTTKLIWVEEYHANRVESSITFTADRQMNGKRLSCRLKGDEGVSDSMKLSIAFEPRSVDKSAVGDGIRAGERLTLQCSSHSSNPKTTMLWKLDNKDLQEKNQEGSYESGDDLGERLTSRVTFRTTRDMDTRTVCCVPVFQKRELDWLARNFVLNVTYAPYTNEGLKQTVQASDGEVKVKFFSNPPPLEYHWRLANGSKVSSVAWLNMKEQNQYEYHLPISVDEKVNKTYTAVISNGIEIPLVITVNTVKHGPSTLPVYAVSEDASTDSKHISVGLIITSTIIATALVILLIVLAVYLFSRRRKKQQQHRKYNHQNSRSPLTRNGSSSTSSQPNSPQDSFNGHLPPLPPPARNSSMPPDDPIFGTGNGSLPHHHHHSDNEVQYSTIQDVGQYLHPPPSVSRQDSSVQTDECDYFPMSLSLREDSPFVTNMSGEAVATGVQRPESTTLKRVDERGGEESTPLMKTPSPTEHIDQSLLFNRSRGSGQSTNGSDTLTNVTPPRDRETNEYILSDSLPRGRERLRLPSQVSDN